MDQTFIVFLAMDQDFNGNNDGIMAGPLTFYAPRRFLKVQHQGTLVDVVSVVVSV